MKVLALRNNTIIEVNDSYGARMIEQGKAVIPPKSEPKETKVQDVPAEEAVEEAETPTKGAKKK